MYVLRNKIIKIVGKLQNAYWNERVKPTMGNAVDCDLKTVYHNMQGEKCVCGVNIKDVFVVTNERTGVTGKLGCVCVETVFSIKRIYSKKKLLLTKLKILQQQNNFFKCFNSKQLTWNQKKCINHQFDWITKDGVFKIEEKDVA